MKSLLSAQFVFCAFLGFNLLGCSEMQERNNQKPISPFTAPEDKVLPDFQIQNLLGDYFVTDYTEYGPGSTTEDWAKGQVGKKAIISRDRFKMWGHDVLNPIYKIMVYEPLSEGNVPFGIRRAFSDFWGVGTERKKLAVLEVYSPKVSHPVEILEIIDEGRLWDTYDGKWLLQWRRKDNRGKIVPLKEPFSLPKRTLGNLETL